MLCEVCGEVIPVKSGRVPRFCSGACRQKAYRARKRAERAAKPSLPRRMTSVDRWTRAKGKRPFRANGLWASSTKAWTWASFESVQSGFGDGFGVMLGDGLACLDLDDCFSPDGALRGWASDALASVVNPIWVERSVSGKGLHAFFESPARDASKRRMPDGGGIEFYYESRFILVTGDAYLR